MANKYKKNNLDDLKAKLHYLTQAKKEKELVAANQAREVTSYGPEGIRRGTYGELTSNQTYTRRPEEIIRPQGTPTPEPVRQQVSADPGASTFIRQPVDRTPQPDRWGKLRIVNDKKELEPSVITEKKDDFEQPSVFDKVFHRSEDEQREYDRALYIEAERQNISMDDAEHNRRVEMVDDLSRKAETLMVPGLFLTAGTVGFMKPLAKGFLGYLAAGGVKKVAVSQISDGEYTHIGDLLDDQTPEGLRKAVYVLEEMATMAGGAKGADFISKKVAGKLAGKAVAPFIEGMAAEEVPALLGELGLKPGVSRTVLNKRVRDLQKQWHPDRVAAKGDQAEIDFYTKEFQNLGKIAETLKKTYGGEAAPKAVAPPEGYNPKVRKQLEALKELGLEWGVSRSDIAKTRTALRGTGRTKEVPSGAYTEAKRKAFLELMEGENRYNPYGESAEFMAQKKEGYISQTVDELIAAGQKRRLSGSDVSIPLDAKLARPASEIPRLPEGTVKPFFPPVGTSNAEFQILDPKKAGSRDRSINELKVEMEKLKQKKVDAFKSTETDPVKRTQIGTINTAIEGVEGRLEAAIATPVASVTGPIVRTPSPESAPVGGRTITQVGTTPVAATIKTVTPTVPIKTTATRTKAASKAKVVDTLVKTKKKAPVARVARKTRTLKDNLANRSKATGDTFSMGNAEPRGPVTIAKKNATVRKRIAEKLEELVSRKASKSFKLVEKGQALADKYGELITERNTPRGAAGAHYTQTGNITVRSLGDIPTVVHELSHNLDKKFGLAEKIGKSNDIGLKANLVKAYQDLYPGAKPSDPTDLAIKEGIPSLITKYALSPTATKKKYPIAVKELLEGDGPLADKLQKSLVKDFGEIIEEYSKLTDQQIIAARRVSDKRAAKTTGGVSPIAQFVGGFSDHIHPLEALAKQQGLGMTNKDPSVPYRHRANVGRVALHNLTESDGFWMIDPEGNTYKKFDYNLRSMGRELMKSGEYENYNDYLIARRIYFENKEMVALEAKENKTKEDHARLKGLKSIHDIEKWDQGVVSREYNKNKSKFAEMDKKFDSISHRAST